MTVEGQKIYGSHPENPIVSIIVPVFNVSKYLDKAIVSIRKQTLKSIEIICVNDGSTDDSMSILMSHVSCDNRILVIDKPNEGYGSACNSGIDEAIGFYIAIVEPDDWIDGAMFLDMVTFAQEFSQEIDIIKTPFWRILSSDTSSERKVNCGYRNRVKLDIQPFTINKAPLLLSQHPSIWSALYRREFLFKHKIRFQPFPGAGWADNPFLIETTCQAKSIIYLDQPYYNYREDTPEKSKLFTQKNPLLPFERWHDMADIIERLEIDDAAILKAHIVRGFMYLSGVKDAIDIESNDRINELIINMFSRMNADIVFGIDTISPKSKRFYAHMLGLPKPKTKYIAYFRTLIAKGLYSFRNTGLKNTFITLKQFFQRST